LDGFNAATTNQYMHISLEQWLSVLPAQQPARLKRQFARFREHCSIYGSREIQE
jgi:hypothetical protein